VQVTVAGRLGTGLTAQSVFALQVTLADATPSGRLPLLVLASPYWPLTVAEKVTDEPYAEGFVPEVSLVEVPEVACVMLKLLLCALLTEL
jgi:hypothetical protein